MSIHIPDSVLVVTCYSKAKKMGPDLSVLRPYMAARAARSLVATEQNLRSCTGERKRDQRGGMSTVTITHFPVDLHILSLLARLRTVKDCCDWLDKDKDKLKIKIKIN